MKIKNSEEIETWRLARKINSESL